jgi:hypothetical protein
LNSTATSRIFAPTAATRFRLSSSAVLVSAPTTAERIGMATTNLPGPLTPEPGVDWIVQGLDRYVQVPEIFFVYLMELLGNEVRLDFHDMVYYSKQKVPRTEIVRLDDPFTLILKVKKESE